LDTHAAFHVERRRHGARVRAADTAAALGIITVGVVLASVLFLEGRSLDWLYFTSTPRNFRSPVYVLFINAALIGLGATVASFGMGFIIGFVTGWERSLVRRPHLEATHGLSPARRDLLVTARAARYLARRIADMYVAIVRGTPLVVQIFFVWEAVILGAPSDWDLRTRSLVAGIMAMTFNTGGYQSEIFRAGISAVPVGQLEAARAVGFRRLGAMRHIVLPQALRLVMPPLTNEFVALFKASSLLFFIGIVEITSLSKTLTNLDPKIFEIFLLSTLLYLSITVPVSRAALLIERRYRIPGMGMAPAGRSSGRVARTP
jgi:glutamine transport system permease protein